MNNGKNSRKSNPNLKGRILVRGAGRGVVGGARAGEGVDKGTVGHASRQHRRQLLTGRLVKRGDKSQRLWRAVLVVVGARGRLGRGHQGGARGCRRQRRGGNGVAG